MRGNKLIRLLRQCALPFLALLVLAGFFLTARGRVQTQFPVLEPQNGVLDARGHDFTASWSWNEDGSGAILTLTCTRDDQTETLTFEGEDIAYSEVPATETSEGEGTYTATVVYDGKTYTDEYKVTLPKLDPAADPDEPAADPDDPSGNGDADKLCKWCGKDHSGSFWQRIVGFFHKIFYFFAHLFGLR